MTITKVTAGLISAEASAIDLNIDANTLYIDASENRVGIGTSSPATPLEVRTSSDTEIAAIRTGSVSAKLGAFASGESRLTSAGNDGFLTFYTGTSSGERVRIDSSGNLLVGKTTIGVGTSGSEIRADGQISIVREFATPLYINRKSSDGDVVDLRKDNTTFGTIGISSNNLIIKSILDDKDIQFRGNDGGSAITALTLDMSNAGAATFNSTISSGDIIIQDGVTPSLILSDTGLSLIHI